MMIKQILLFNGPMHGIEIRIEGPILRILLLTKDGGYVYDNIRNRYVWVMKVAVCMNCRYWRPLQHDIHGSCLKSYRVIEPDTSGEEPIRHYDLTDREDHCPLYQEETA